MRLIEVFACPECGNNLKAISFVHLMLMGVHNPFRRKPRRVLQGGETCTTCGYRMPTPEEVRARIK